MRVVTAGIGLRAGHVLSILKEAMPEVEFVGFYDPQPTHLEMIGTEVPQFDTIETMLAQTAPDLFFVGSPNSFHLEHIKIGLAAGVRIFTEKPVVTTKEETMELAALLAEHGTDRVMVGLVLRYSQHMVDLRRVLDQLGPITSLEANEHIAPYHGAFFMRDWRRMVQWSGGFMLEKCCHDIDIYNYFAPTCGKSRRGTPGCTLEERESCAPRPYSCLSPARQPGNAELSSGDLISSCRMTTMLTKKRRRQPRRWPGHQHSSSKPKPKSVYSRL